MLVRSVPRLCLASSSGMITTSDVQPEELLSDVILLEGTPAAVSALCMLGTSLVVSTYELLANTLTGITGT